MLHKYAYSARHSVCLSVYSSRAADGIFVECATGKELKCVDTFQFTSDRKITSTLHEHLTSFCVRKWLRGYLGSCLYLGRPQPSASHMGNPSPDNPPLTLQTTKTLAQCAEVKSTPQEQNCSTALTFYNVTLFNGAFSFVNRSLN
jgi:hypothetical protein